MEEKTPKETTLLSWKAPEFIQYNRSWKWFAGAAVAYFTVMVYAIWAKDWFIMPIATFLLIYLYFYLKKSPSEIAYKISELGIYVNGKLYPFNELHSFWLVLNAEQKVLNILFRKKYLPELRIIFYGVDTVQLKTTLSKFIPEQEDRSESLPEKLIRLLKLN